MTRSSPAPSSTARWAQVDDVEAGRLAAALDDDLPGARAGLPGVDGDDDGLAPEPRGAAGDQVRIGDGRRVEGDLVGPGAQHVAHLVHGADATAHGQRDERPSRGSLDDVEQRAATLGGRRDVEEDDLVGAFAGVSLGELGRIAFVDQVDEARALDHATVGDIEARDHPAAQHQAARTRSTKLARNSEPVRPAPLRVELHADNAPAGDRADERAAVGRPGKHEPVGPMSRGAPAYEWTK